MFPSISGKFLLALAIAGTAGLAQARSDVQWSIGVQTGPVYAQPQPVYVQPQPVYVQPAPVYVQPRPVYVQPAPVYAQPAPVYIAPGYGGWRYRDDDWGRRHWRHHHRHGYGD